MGMKIKQSPKPVNDKKKRVASKESGKKSGVPMQVKNAVTEADKTTPAVLQVSSECALNKEQASVAFIQ